MPDQSGHSNKQPQLTLVDVQIGQVRSFDYSLVTIRQIVFIARRLIEHYRDTTRVIGTDHFLATPLHCRIDKSLGWIDERLRRCIRCVADFRSVYISQELLGFFVSLTDQIDAFVCSHHIPQTIGSYIIIKRSSRLLERIIKDGLYSKRL